MQSLFKKKKIIKEESNKSKQLREHADNRQEEGGKCRKQAKHPRQVAALVPARKKGIESIWMVVCGRTGASNCRKRHRLMTSFQCWKCLCVRARMNC